MTRFGFSYRVDAQFADNHLHRARLDHPADALVAANTYKGQMAQHGIPIEVCMGEIVQKGRGVELVGIDEARNP